MKGGMFIVEGKVMNLPEPENQSKLTQGEG
jgi:hypothetical protein